MKWARIATIVLLATLVILSTACTDVPTGGNWSVDPSKGEFTIKTTPWAVTPVTGTTSSTKPITATATITGSITITGTTRAITGTGTLTQTATPTKTDPQAAHFARLERLDPTFRSQGTEAWLRAAGISWDSIGFSARQPEEETSPSGKISVSGKQIDGKNVIVNWPNIVTTDVPGRITESPQTIKYQPDPNNGSTLYTNVVANGPVTIWIDGQNWGQFTSKLGTPNSSTMTTNTGPCFTIAQLDSRFGIDRTAQGSRNGLLYDGNVLSGAVLRLNAQQILELEKLKWTIQGSNPSVKSAWSPISCRPLSQ